MKYVKFFLCFFCFFSATIYSFGEKKLSYDETRALQVKEDDDYEYNKIVQNIVKAQPPFISGNYLVFTAASSSKYVGIATDIDNFKKINTFFKRTISDSQNTTITSVYFYLLKLPKHLTCINYRLIIDGLWTTDPLNPIKIYNPSAKILLSHFDINRPIVPVTEIKTDGCVHFVYKSTPGQVIRVGGSFSNWDSWIYEMTEIESGLYTIDIPLAPGIYYYSFYNGMTSFVDPGNTEFGYGDDGRKVSMIKVY